MLGCSNPTGTLLMAMAGTRLGVLVLFHVLLGAAMYVNQSVPNAYMVRHCLSPTAPPADAS